ncbi:hypothetical protein D3C87_2132890 [compost metagenome]
MATTASWKPGCVGSSATLKVRPAALLNVGMRFCWSLSRNWYSRNCCSPPFDDDDRICDSWV